MKTLTLTYLRRAGAPRAQKRGPGCFSRPSAQVSASLDALFPEHFGAGETTAGAKPLNPCAFPFKHPEGVEWGWGGGVLKITLWRCGRKRKEEILQQNQLPDPRNARLESGGRFRAASPSLTEVAAASAPLRLGLHTALLSAPKHPYWPYSGDTGAVGKQRQPSNWGGIN